MAYVFRIKITQQESLIIYEAEANITAKCFRPKVVDFRNGLDDSTVSVRTVTAFKRKL